MTRKNSPHKDSLPMDFEKLAALMETPQTFAVFGHINPDGDAIGAMLALGRALRARGKSVTWISHDGVPGFFHHMLLAGDTVLDKTTALPCENLRFDCVILTDCATRKRAGDAFAPLFDAAPLVINIDHHAINIPFTDNNFIDPDASSTCEILFRFMESRGWDVTPDIAAPLYLGIMYDTGRFIHGNTTPAVFRICSELVARGADPSFIATAVYNNRTLASRRLLGYALSHMQTAADDRVAWAVITRATFNEMGASDIDTEGVVEIMGRYAACEVFMIFTEGPDGKSRASTRSAGRVKVNEICQMFGGGGHAFASGARNAMPVHELAEKFVQEAIKRLP